MKRVYTLLRSTSIKKRLLVGFILIPLLVLSVFFCIYDIVTKRMILEKSEQNSEKLLTIIVENFYLNMNTFEQELSEIISNELLHASVTSDGKTDDDKSKLFLDIHAYMNSKTHILSNTYELAVYTKDLQLTHSKGFKNFDKETVANYASQAEQRNDDSVWFHTYIDDVGVIGVAQAMFDEQGSCNGYVFLAIKETAFTSSFAGEQVSDNALLVVNKDSQYLFGQYPMNDGVNLTYDGGKEIMIGGQQYLVKEKPIPNLDWRVINLVNTSHELESLYSLRSVILLYVFMIVVILCVIMAFIYHSIYEPLRNILTSMNALSDKRLDVHIDDTGKDELHELANNYNDLVHRIKELVLKVEFEQSEKRDAEIKMLQAQINPHFLFNTLNTLRYLAILNDDKPVSQGIDALAKLLRNTIMDSKEVVHIIDEIQNLENYIIIQKLRYGNLFETEIYLEEEVKQYKIMKFLLQPIVENAILHGFEEDRENQLLQIRVTCHDNGLLVEVKDNGKGFDINEQKVSIQNKTLSGIGIKNIEERILLTYGNSYRMETHSVLGSGTTICLYLPKIMNEEAQPCIE